MTYQVEFTSPLTLEDVEGIEETDANPDAVDLWFDIIDKQVPNWFKENQTHLDRTLDHLEEI